jgi:cell wall-associated NlpC family hydrolase
VRPAHLVLSACAAFAVTVPLLAGGATVARAADGPFGSGGAGIGAPRESPSTPAHPTVAGDVAKIIDGEAYAPSFAPPAVKEAIWAGDRIRQMPYVLGGGHGDWSSPGYDCSGSVSYVLHAAGLLRVSEDSGQLERWGVSGPGDWITVYTNAGHAFIQIAGIRLDTSAEQDPNPPSGTGPRWRPLMHGTRGFVARHPADY